MKAYGRARGDSGCCPGHDTFPSETYNSQRSKRAQARDTKLQHQLARARLKSEMRKDLEDTATHQ